MGKLSMWLRQPTTVAGMSTFFGTMLALLLQQMNATTAVPLLAGAAMSIILPDNSAAKQQAEGLANDVLTHLTGAKGEGA